MSTKKSHAKTAAETAAAPSSSKKKSASPSKKRSRTAGGSSHSYPSKVRAAIAGLAERGGSSYQAIEKYIGEHHKDQDVEHKLVMRALNNLVEKGEVERAGTNSYKLTAKAKAASKKSTGARAGKASSTRRRAKDPNAPKRPKSAYMFYSTEHREAMKKKHPNAKFGELGKLLGAAWKALPAKDKAKYEKEAAADKARYDKAKAAYQATLPKKEKRPPSAYNLFMQEEMPKLRAKHPSKTVKELMKEIGPMWKKMTEAQKKKYVSGAAEAKKLSESKKSSSKKSETPEKTPTPPKKPTPSKKKTSAGKKTSPKTAAASHAKPAASKKSPKSK